MIRIFRHSEGRNGRPGLWPEARCTWRAMAWTGLLNLLVVWYNPAFAERVLVETPSGEKGHAWLFGSRGACWLAVPRHVIVDPFTSEPTAFSFFDQKGVGGHSLTPIPIDSVAGAKEAAGDEDDLAFAKVEFGREAGKCFSRLGLNSLAYGTALRAGPDLTVFNLLPTSFGTFNTLVGGGGLGSKEGLLILGPLDEEQARKFLKRGLSGAVAEATIGGTIVPFAMVLEVSEESGTALALRFDRLRAAFDLVEGSLALPESEPSKGQLSYNLVALEGASVLSTETVSTLSEEGGCWRVTPAADGSRTALIVQVQPGDVAIRGVVLRQSEGCEALGARISVDARVGTGDDWSKMADCRQASAGGSFDCTFELRPPRQLRIVIRSESEAGFRSLELR